MLSKVVSKIILTSVPINTELALLRSVVEPVEPHVHCLGLLLFYCIIDDTIGSIVVSFEWGGWLGEFHGPQTITDCHGFLGIHE